MPDDRPQGSRPLIERQSRFALIPNKTTDRSVNLADFHEEYADGRIEVSDVKSAITRGLPSCVISDKLMRECHGMKVIAN